MIFALNFPNQKFYLIPFPFPVPAWLLGCFIIGMDAFGVAGVGSERIAYTAHLGGALFGLAYYFSGIRLTGGSNASGYSAGGGWKLPSFGKKKLKIFDPEKRDADLDRRADAVLEKMHREGADSLTAKERKVLDAYSRRVRDKQK